MKVCLKAIALLAKNTSGSPSCKNEATSLDSIAVIAPVVVVGSPFRWEPDVMEPESADKEQKEQEQRDEDRHCSILYCWLPDVLLARCE